MPFLVFNCKYYQGVLSIGNDLLTTSVAKIIATKTRQNDSIVCEFNSFFKPLILPVNWNEVILLSSFFCLFWGGDMIK